MFERPLLSLILLPRQCLPEKMLSAEPAGAATGRPPPPSLRRFTHARFAAPQDACVGVEGRRRQGDAADSAPLPDAVTADALTSRRGGCFQHEDEERDERRGHTLESSIQLKLSISRVSDYGGHAVCGRLVPLALHTVRSPHRSRARRDARQFVNPASHGGGECPHVFGRVVGRAEGVRDLPVGEFRE